MASVASLEALGGFTPTTRQTPTELTSPKSVALPKPFAVCVIGASRGIGEEIAYSFAHAGASAIVLAARSSKALQAVANKVRSIKADCHVQVFDCDVSSAASVGTLASQVESSVGRLDVLVMNSGYAGTMEVDITRTPLDSARTAMEVNYMGTFYAAHHFVPLLMKSENGAKAFFAVGSLAAAIVNGPIANAQYCVSKTAQAKLVEHIHEQYREQGLLAVTVHPGAVKTKMAQDSKIDEDIIDKLCVDSADLCGAFCVWLVKEPGRIDWLGGRLVSATWDVKELEQRRSEIVEKDLLKFYAHT